MLERHGNDFSRKKDLANGLRWGLLLGAKRGPGDLRFQQNPEKKRGKTEHYVHPGIKEGRACSEKDFRK